MKTIRLDKEENRDDILVVESSGEKIKVTKKSSGLFYNEIRETVCCGACIGTGEYGNSETYSYCDECDGENPEIKTKREYCSSYLTVQRNF